MTEKKMAYVSENGDDKNDGLTEKTAVRTRERAIKVSVREGTEEFNITDTLAYFNNIVRGDNN